jgi:uncharacterized protein
MGENQGVPEISYPGVYVEEVSLRARSIEGVPTSGTAFVVSSDGAEPLDRAVTVRDYADLARALPGVATATAEASVRPFFENGGTELHVVEAAPGEALTPALSGLDGIPDLGLLCLPGETDPERLTEALEYAERRGLFLLVDPPGDDPEEAIAMTHALAQTGSANAAVFFPRLLVDGFPVPPSGAVAGLYARTDRTRGVWTAPAGPEATLLGVDGPTLPVSDHLADRLSGGAVNTIRTFPDGRTVVWGARTVQGSDPAGSGWKYVPVRRFALYLERSIDRGIRWAVFEPNDEPLWAQLRQQVEAFLVGLWRAGAVAGQTPQQAYFVKTDRTTMTQSDLDNGRLVILVGVAPLRPAEFVTIRIGQWMTPGPPATTVVVSGRGLGGVLRLPHRPVRSEGFRLEVDAGDGWVAWTRVDALGQAGPEDRAYTVDPSAGEVRFGDGQHGARLPTGEANVRASYRQGAGGAGTVPNPKVQGFLTVVRRWILRAIGLLKMGPNA